MRDVTQMPPDNHYDTKREQEVMQPDSVEALSWLQTPDNLFRTFGGNGIRKGYAGKRAVDFVQCLYRRGAVRVTAVGVVRVQGEYVRHEAIKGGLPETDVMEATDRLVVEMPSESGGQAELINQWANTFGRRMFDVPTDTGQKYLFYWWD